MNVTSMIRPVNVDKTMTIIVHEGTDIVRINSSVRQNSWLKTLIIHNFRIDYSYRMQWIVHTKAFKLITYKICRSNASPS